MTQDPTTSMQNPYDIFEYGELNPIGDTICKTRPNIDAVGSTMDTIREATRIVFTPNTVQAMGPFRGIVLRVEPPTNTAGFTAMMTSILQQTPANGVMNAQNLTLIRVKVRIPELHCALPVPTELPTRAESNPNHKIIDLYPTFVAKSTAVAATPIPGEIVWVDFGNKLTFEDPIYLGQVLDQSVSILAPSNPTPSSPFNNPQTGTAPGGPGGTTTAANLADVKAQCREATKKIRKSHLRRRAIHLCMFGGPAFSPTPIRKPGSNRGIVAPPGWGRQNIKRVEFTYYNRSKGKVRLHKSLADDFVKIIEEASRLAKYAPEQITGWNPRTMTSKPDSWYSNHTFGSAVDIDSAKNKRLGNHVPGEMVQKYPKFIDHFEANGWEWAGNWRNGKGRDDMHFEYRVMNTKTRLQHIAAGRPEDPRHASAI